MSDKDEHPIRTGLIIAAGTLAIGYVATFIPGLFQGIWNICKQCWHFLLATSKTPHWLLLVLAVLALPSLWKLCQMFFPLKSAEEKPTPSTWLDYTQDSFLGAVWRWSYDYNNQIIRPWCFCPRCDTQLVYSEGYAGVGVRFRCEHCNVYPCEDEGSAEDAMAKVTRQIDRKLRTGEWERVVEARSKKVGMLPPG